MKTISYLATLMCIFLIAGCTYLAYTYVFITGYGLHPILAACAVAVLVVCVYALGCIRSADEQGDEEHYDITNDIYRNH